MITEEFMENLKKEISSSMKSGNKLRTDVIRMLLDDINKETVVKNKPLTEDVIVSCVNKAIKRHEDTIRIYRDAEKLDETEKWKNIDRELDEMNVLKEFQPKQLTEEEVEMIVLEAINELGATSKRETGKVMAKVMPQVKGKCNGKIVNDIVAKHLV